VPRGQFGVGPFTGRLLHSRALLTVSSRFTNVKFTWFAGGFSYLLGDTAVSTDLLCCRWYEFWTPQSCGYAKNFGSLASLSLEINLLFGRLLALLEF
jgi:hypothetical protein